MKNTIIREYSIGNSSWDSLKKRDYINLSKWMIAKYVPQYARNDALQIEVSFVQGGITKYSLEKFATHFSAATQYDSLKIGLYEPNFAVSLVDAFRHSFTLLQSRGQQRKALPLNMYLHSFSSPIFVMMMSASMPSCASRRS